MDVDAVFAKLLDDVDRATAALRAHVEGRSEENDFISLREAEREFRRSNYTVRRWAKDEELGVEVNGRWYLRRSLVRRYKFV